MSGCAGQRCMAASAMVAVGGVDHIIDKLCEESRKIVPGDNLGSVISKEAKARIEGYITAAEEAGAKAILLECITQETAKKITSSISLPTIGIGSSKYCDGQVLVFDDLIKYLHKCTY